MLPPGRRRRPAGHKADRRLRVAEHPGELKVTPGKMVYEIQPKLEWDKGKAVLYLLKALGLDRDDVAPLYLRDDITDEDAFRGSPARASASSSVRPMIRRSGAAAHPPRSCWTRSRRWNDFWTRWPGERRARRPGGLAYESFEPDEEGLREALTSTATAISARAARPSGRTRAALITRGPIRHVATRFVSKQ